MKAAKLYILLQLFCAQGWGQTGPAGVGSSSNNVLWLKADAGTSSTTNNTSISFWNDQSGNGVDVTQSVTAQQPSFATNVMNGFPGVHFDNVNSNNLNDKMIGPDSPLLDNTTGYTFFMVNRPQFIDGNARVIISKRTGVAINQSFMHFYYTSGRLFTDIQTNNDRYNTIFTFSANNNYLICQQYNGSLAALVRCRTYVQGGIDITAGETSTLVPDNASPLVIGSTDATDPRPFGGYINEVILYRNTLIEAQRIIVDNYLAAKYGITLSANDRYAGDETANGNYDFEVAGVGKESDGANMAFASSVSGGLGLTVNSGLDNGDYLLAGHATSTNDATASDVGGMTGSLNARWQRVWYFDVSNAGANINADILFDMSDGGINGWVPGVLSNYVLLFRAGQSGNWTELGTASSINGDQVNFAGVTFTTDGYYTIGTRNNNASSLPVTLLSFNAEPEHKYVNITWRTAMEKNLSVFAVQRAADGLIFETIDEVLPKGPLYNYAIADKDPLPGLSYYRLICREPGDSTVSALVPVNYAQRAGKVYPNPANISITVGASVSSPVTEVVLYNDSGSRVFYASREQKHATGSWQLVLPLLQTGKYSLVKKHGSTTTTEPLIISR